MNDYEYTYRQEVQERKALVPSARKRKNGVHSTSCTLPSDHLTPAQRKKLNGPVKTYNTCQPMSWAQFKEMPKDLQESYLRYVAQRFRVTMQAIGKELFGRGPRTLYNYCARNRVAVPTSRGTRENEAGNAALRAWALGEDDRDEPAPEEEMFFLAEPAAPVEPDLSENTEPDEPDMTDEPDEPVTPTARNPITSATLRMSGSAEEVLASLAGFIGGRDVALEVNIYF